MVDDDKKSFIKETPKQRYARNNRDVIYAMEKRYRQRVMDEKRYYCAKHDKAFWRPDWYKNHMNSRLHNPDLYVSYECKLCGIKTRYKNDYNRHLNTKRHIMNVRDDKIE